MDLLRQELAPRTRDEFRRVRERILAELTPEQKKRFEQQVGLRWGPRRAEDQGLLRRRLDN